MAGGALYGAVIGSWTGPRLALYAAIKLPLVLELTAALTVVFAWMVARLAGLPLALSRIVVLSALPLAVASLVLVSLTPVAAFFTYCARPADLTAQTTHNVLYLMHTALVALAGLAGTLTLLEALRRLGLPLPRTLGVYAGWLLTYALVGGEVAWALRPFVGSVYYPVAFLREDALDGNVYEFVFTDILPYLLGGG